MLSFFMCGVGYNKKWYWITSKSSFLRFNFFSKKIGILNIFKIFLKKSPGTPKFSPSPYFWCSLRIWGQTWPVTLLWTFFEKSRKFDFFENFEKFCENTPRKNFFPVFFYETGSNQRDLEQKVQKKNIWTFWSNSILKHKFIEKRL